MNAAGTDHRERRGAEVTLEQSLQMTRRDPEPACYPRHTAIVVERLGGDQPQRAADDLGHTAPVRSSRALLRATTEAGSEPGFGGGRRGGEEHDVARERRLHRADRPAVDPRRADTDEESSVEARVARDARSLAGLDVEDGNVVWLAHESTIRARSDPIWPFSDLVLGPY